MSITIVSNATGFYVLGVNLFGAIADDFNFVPESRRVNRSLKPDMLIIAEQAMTRREIETFLSARAEAYVKKCESYVAQLDVVAMLQMLCEQHHWSNYQRRKTVEQIAARACRRNGVYRLRRVTRTSSSPGCPE